MLQPLAIAQDRYTWYLVNGILLSDVDAVYLPFGAHSLADSYINLAHPGTNDAKLPPGYSAPGFDSQTGWSFNGINQLLLSVPDSANISIFCKFTNAAGGLFGCSTGVSFFGAGANNLGGQTYYWSDGGGNAPGGVSVVSGVIGISGTKGYLNGQLDASGLISPHIPNGDTIKIGGLDIYVAVSKVQAVIMINRIVTEDEALAISNALVLATEMIWYRSGGSPLPLVAYKAIGAANIADSYINQADPHTNDIVPLVVPGWDTSNGWKLDGLTQHLDTGIVPHSGMSMLIRYSAVFDIDLSYAALIGQYTANARFDIMINPAFIVYASGESINAVPTLTDGVLGISGQQGFRNGIPDGTTMVAWSDIAANSIYIGSRAGAYMFPVYIQAVAIYDSILTNDEMLRITNAMATLPSGNQIPTEQDLVDAYIAKKFGAFYHFGMATFTGNEQAAANVDPNIFAPTNLDIDQWLDAAVSAGCKYACLTTKHSGGFALWPTLYHVNGYTPYSISQTAWYSANGSPDIVGLFVSKCRTHGLNPVLYFGVKDTTYEARSNTTAESDPVGYLAMITSQITELLTNYGDITAIWFDGWQWTDVSTHIPFMAMFNLIKSIQPNCILINNNASPNTITQIQTFESIPIPSGNTRAAEASFQVRQDGNWFWHISDDAPLVDAATINAAIADANSKNASYLLDLTPNQNGMIPDNQVSLMAVLHP